MNAIILYKKTTVFVNVIKDLEMSRLFWIILESPTSSCKHPCKTEAQRDLTQTEEEEAL